MICIELKFDTHCQACKEPLKAGELVLMDENKRVCCIGGCLSKPDGTRPKPDVYAKIKAPVKRKAAPIQTHVPIKKERVDDLSHSPMANKLRDDINNMAKGA